VGLAESYACAPFQIVFMGLRRLENEGLMRSSDHCSYVVFVVSGGEKKMGGKFKSKKKGNGLYTKGELNKLIDSLCHPLFETDEGFILVDGLLHAMVEQDPPVTVKKFIKYNLPKLLEQIGEKSREVQH